MPRLPRPSLPRSVLASIPVLASWAGAQSLTVFDGFDYGATGAGLELLDGRDGGAGWDGPWLGAGSLGLASWWQLESSTQDSGPFAAHGTLTNGTYTNAVPALTWSSASLTLSAMQPRTEFDLSAHAAKFNRLLRGTLSAWIRTSNPGPIMAILGAANRATGRGLQLFLDSQGTVEFEVKGDVPAGIRLTGAQRIADGNWHHVAVAVDGAGFAVVYVDGNADTSGPSGFFGHVHDLDGLWIGRTWKVGPTRYFGGDIDDVAIWGSTLSQAEIQSLAGTPPSTISGNTSPAGPALARASLATPGLENQPFGTYRLAPVGNRARDDSGNTAVRFLQSAIDLGATRDYYMSCLLRRADVSLFSVSAGEIRLSDASVECRFGWDAQGRWLAGLGNTTTTGAYMPGFVYFVVLKTAASSTSPDQAFVKAYQRYERVHPDDGTLIGMGSGANEWTVITAPVLLDSRLGALSIQLAGTDSAIEVDEIRFGDTWESVTRLAYGQGCLGAEIGKTNRPALGSTSFAIDLNLAAPNQPAFLMLGTTRTSIALSAAGAPGCSLLTSSEVALPGATGSLGTAAIGVPIPVNVSLPAAFFAQWIAVHPTTSHPLRLSFSDGLEVLIER